MTKLSFHYCLCQNSLVSWLQYIYIYCTECIFLSHWDSRYWSPSQFFVPFQSLATFHKWNVLQCITNVSMFCTSCYVPNEDFWVHFVALTFCLVSISLCWFDWLLHTHRSALKVYCRVSHIALYEASQSGWDRYTHIFVLLIGLSSSCSSTPQCCCSNRWTRMKLELFWL